MKTTRESRARKSAFTSSRSQAVTTSDFDSQKGKKGGSLAFCDPPLVVETASRIG
jgi:hypothetical protein